MAQGIETSIAASAACSADPVRSAKAVARCPRYLSLDIWRGFACTFVLLDHTVCQVQSTDNDLASLICRAMSHLWIGVPMFFVISGYCISATADASRRRLKSTAATWDYFTRRFRRIYPPYWICLALTALLVLCLDPRLFSDPSNRIRNPLDLTAGQWFGNLTLTESWRWLFFDTQQGYLVGTTWTLCYEEQFYFVMGMILLLCPQRYFTAVIVVTIATIATRLGVKVFGWQVSGLFLDGKWLIFALGVGLYYSINYASRRFVLMMNALLALGLTAVVLAPIHYAMKLEFAAGLGLTLVASLLHPWDSLTVNARVLQPIRQCGLMCYSLYLVHWPIVLIITRWQYLRGVTSPTATLLFTMPLCVFAAVTASYTFHRFVERRFLNPPRPVAPQPVARAELVGNSAGMPAVPALSDS